MHIASQQTREDMEAAAELRALGATWETIGEVLGRRAFVLTRWVRIYPDEWEVFLREAEERAERKRTSELRSMLKEMLRHESSRVRRATAENLRRERLAEKATEPPRDPRDNLSGFLREIEQMTDAELEEQLAEFLRQSDRLPAKGTAP
jgi:hypothetical protein